MTNERLKELREWAVRYVMTVDEAKELFIEIERLQAKCNRLIPAWANVPGDWMQPGDLDKEGA